MVSIGRLYGATKNTRVNKSLVTAKLSGVELDFDPNFKFGVDNKDPSYLSKFSLGQTPAFEGKDGLLLTESDAIALHIASHKENNPLLGKGSSEYAKILQYLFFTETSIVPHAIGILLPHLGYAPYSPEAEAAAYTKIERSLTFLENELKGKKYLVGDNLTLADVITYFNLETFFSKFYGKEDQQKYPNLTNYLVNIGKIKEFTEFTGGFNLAETRAKYQPKN